MNAPSDLSLAPVLKIKRDIQSKKKNQAWYQLTQKEKKHDQPPEP